MRCLWLKAALLLGMMPLASMAGEAWQRVYDDASMSVYIDTASLVREAGSVSFRERETPAQPILDTASMRKIQETQFKRQADCTTRRIRLLSRAMFSEKGTLVLYESIRPQAAVWEMPQSRRDISLLEAVCGPA
jgi:hypothetical protein